MPAGDAAAYALLRGANLDMLPMEGLALRADLAERLGDVADAFSSLARRRALATAGGERVLCADISRRLAALALGGNGRHPGRAIAMFEDAITAAPADALVADTLFRLYERLDDGRTRTQPRLAAVAGAGAGIE